MKEGVDHHKLIHTVQTYLEKFVFGIAQSIGKYYSQIGSLQLVEDISNIMEFFTVQYSVHNGTTLDDGQLQVQHLKKMVEDYIIQQLTAAMSNHGVFNPTILIKSFLLYIAGVKVSMLKKQIKLNSQRV